MIEGGCFCGFVRYRAAGSPFHETSCHCSICRRTSGAPFVAWFSVAGSDFSFTSGEPATFRSSEHGTRSFCPRCGTPLTFRSDRHPQELDVTTCSLDDPERLPPRDHTQTSARLSWLVSDGLPEYAEARSAPGGPRDFLSEWHRIVAERDLAGLRARLAEGVSIGAPPYWTRIEGRDVVHHLLGLILETIEGFTYHREWRRGAELALEFRGRVGDLELQGIDLIELDESSRVAHLDVLMRPAGAISALREVIAPKMADFLSARAAAR